MRNSRRTIAGRTGRRLTWRPTLSRRTAVRASAKVGRVARSESVRANQGAGERAGLVSALVGVLQKPGEVTE
jgi:hypothetical protein